MTNGVQVNLKKDGAFQHHLSLVLQRILRRNYIIFSISRFDNVVKFTKFLE
jgi:hypothetical protein